MAPGSVEGEHQLGPAPLAQRLGDSTGFVLIGDAGDDGSPSCGPNNVGGSVSLAHNGAGVELGANTISGSVSLTNNTGSGPDAENAAPEVEANHIGGSMSYTANNSAPTDDHQPNLLTGGGTASGQCTGLA